jgi:hypothetical protein
MANQTYEMNELKQVSRRSLLKGMREAFRKRQFQVLPGSNTLCSEKNKAVVLPKTNVLFFLEQNLSGAQKLAKLMHDPFISPSS